MKYRKLASGFVAAAMAGAGGPGGGKGRRRFRYAVRRGASCHKGEHCCQCGGRSVRRF